jgi:uncharacterized repeat protein (TIGR01451 family)
MAGGLIAMPIAVLPGHSVPATSVTTTASAGRPAVPGLRYLVSVKDIGTLGAPHLTITQTLPAGLKFVSASRHGVAAGGRVTWLTGIQPGGSQTFTVVTQLTRTPAGLLRLAAVACAAPQGSARPMVCAAHLDRLASGSLGADRTAYIGTGLAVLAVGAFIVLVARRAGRRRLPG